MATREPVDRRVIRPGMALGLCVVLLFLAASGITALRGGYAGMESVLEALGVILAAGLTLAVYSFLYRDNPLFKLAEHVYLGVSVGYATVVTVHQYLAKQVYDPLIEPILHPGTVEPEPKWILILPVIWGSSCWPGSSRATPGSRGTPSP